VLIGAGLAPVPGDCPDDSATTRSFAVQHGVAVAHYRAEAAPAPGRSCGNSTAARMGGSGDTACGKRTKSRRPRRLAPSNCSSRCPGNCPRPQCATSAWTSRAASATQAGPHRLHRDCKGRSITARTRWNSRSTWGRSTRGAAYRDMRLLRLIHSRRRTWWTAETGHPIESAAEDMLGDFRDHGWPAILATGAAAGLRLWGGRM
jgi:hypothetical protein